MERVQEEPRIGRHLKGSSYYSAAQTEHAVELEQKILKLKSQDIDTRIEEQSEVRAPMGSTKNLELIIHEGLDEFRGGAPLGQEMISPLKCELNLTDTSVQQMKASYLSQQSPVSYTIVEPDHEVRAFALDDEVAESSMQEHDG